MYITISWSEQVERDLQRWYEQWPLSLTFYWAQVSVVIYFYCPRSPYPLAIKYTSSRTNFALESFCMFVCNGWGIYIFIYQRLLVKLLWLEAENRCLRSVQPPITFLEAIKCRWLECLVRLVNVYCACGSLKQRLGFNLDHWGKPCLDRHCSSKC